LEGEDILSKKLKKLSSLIPIAELEQEAQNQIYQALDLDFLIKLAIMPDCHTGYTLPIGGVALLDNVISPEYVGYDIGCGMCYIALNISAKKFFNTDKKKTKFFESVYKKIPVGFNSREKAIEYKDFKTASGNKVLADKVESRLYIQLGTLGGGNHFIEIGENRKGYVTITIHSGSRNIGHSIASYYMKLSKRIDTDLPKGFFHLHSVHGQQYLQDMNFALEYALENRKIMMRKVLSLFGFTKYEISLSIDHHLVNENHNHAVLRDNHVLHRKGATPAHEGQIGIIPGSMKTGVYVTEGLGNEEYLSSASHGAGRKMSRTKAKETVTMERFRQQMSGIVAKVDKSTRDEAPDAYKDLHNIIKEQEGIVIKTVDYTTPLINIKS
jgi:tRNA-splicing ligase RtcB